MTLHPSGRFLYVMNAGANNVSAFAVHPVTGVLAASPASPFAVGAIGYTPKLFLVESSGRFLYVVSTIEDTLGTATSVSYYSVDQATGAINPTPAGTFSLGFFAPAGLVSRRGNKFLYLAGTASPASGSAVSIFTIELDPATGIFADASPLGGQGQFARCWPFLPMGNSCSSGADSSWVRSIPTRFRPTGFRNIRTIPFLSQALRRCRTHSQWTHRDRISTAQLPAWEFSASP